jgi:hypothetical protein
VSRSLYLQQQAGTVLERGSKVSSDYGLENAVRGERGMCGLPSPSRALRRKRLTTTSLSSHRRGGACDLRLLRDEEDKQQDCDDEEDQA